MKLGSHSVSGTALIFAATPPIIYGVALCYLDYFHKNFFSANNTLWAPLGVMIGALTATITGVVFATYSIEAQTRNAKVKATFDFLNKMQWDNDYLTARETYLSLVRAKEDLTRYLAPKDHEYAEAKARCEALRNITNDLELTAIAIERHVLDEEFVKSYHGTAMRRDFKALRPYIQAVRIYADNDKIFINLEKLVNRWGGPL